MQRLLILCILFIYTTGALLAQADYIQITTQPVNTEAGQVVAGHPVVTVYEADDTPFEGANVTVTLNKNDFTGTSTTSVTTNASGQATFSNLVIETADEGYQLTFSSGSLSDISSNNFNITAATPDHMVVTTQPGDTIQGYTIPGTPAIMLLDVYDNPVPAIDITVSVNKNTLNGTLTKTTGADGIADFDDLSLDVDDNGYELTFDADDTGAPGVADGVSGTFEIFEELGTLSISNQTANSVVSQPVEGASVIEAPKVLMENISGDPLEGISIVAILKGGSFSENSVDTVTTNAQGYVVFDSLIIESTGSGYEIVFTTGTQTVANVISDAFDVLAHSGTISLNQQPVESIENYAVEGPPTIYIEDGGTQVSGVDVTAYINKNSFKGTSEVTVQTNGSGIAVFDNLIIETIDTDYQIVFKAAQTGIPLHRSNFFDVVEELAVLSVQQQSTLTIAGEPVNGIPTVQLTDKGTGNPPGSPVNVYAYINKSNFSGESDTIVAATPDNNGIATFDSLILNDADTDYEIRFSTNSSGIADITTDLFEVIEVEGIMTIDPQPAETIEGYTLSGPPTVTILDPSDQGISGISVEAILNQNSFSSGTETQTTDIDGKAVFNDLVIDDVAEDYQMTFDVDINTGVVSQTSEIFKIVDESAVLTVQNQPALTIAGEIVNNSPSVLLEDAATGDPVQNATIHISLNKGSFASGATSVNTNSSGIATFDDLVIDTDDTNYQLIFSTGTSGIADVQSNTFDVVPVGGQITITQQPLETVDGYVVEGPPAIEIKDGATPKPGLDVTAVINKNNFTAPSTTTITTDANGEAVFDNLILDQADDNYTITFTLDPADSIPNKTSDQFDVVDEVAIISMQNQPSLTIAGEPLNGPPTIKLETPGGNPINGGTIHASLNQSAFSTSSVTSVTTNESGVAVFDSLIIDDSNIGYIITFSSGSSGIAPMNSNAFEVVAPEGIMHISQQPVETVDGETIAGPPAITLKETNGDAWGGSEVNVTVAVNKNGFTSGTLTQTTTSGFAVFDDLILNSIDNDYQLTFSTDLSERIADTISDNFDVVAVNGNLNITLQPSETVSGDPINGPPTVRLTNLSGNPVPDVDIDVSLNKNTFNGSSTLTATTNSNGEAVFNNLIIDDSDTDYAITFSTNVSGIADVTSNLFEITDASLSMTVSTQPQQTVAGNVVGGHPAVTVTNGSPIDNVVVTASLNKNSFAGSSTLTATTNGSGVATFDNLVINTAGTDYKITFNADYSGVPNVASNAFEITNAVADNIAITVQPEATQAGSVISGPPTAVLYDAFGNPVSGENISVAPNQHSIAAGTTTKTTGANGEVVFDDLIINTSEDNYQLFFTAPGGVSGSSDIFAVTNAPAHTINILTQPSETVAGAAISGPPLVVVEDEYGNAVQGETVIVSEEGGYAIDNGTLSLETPADGEVAFTDLVISTEGTGYQFRFSVDGIHVLSNTFNVVPGTIFSRFHGGDGSGFQITQQNDIALGQTPVRIEIITQPQESVVGTTVVGPPEIAVYDAVDQPVSNLSVIVTGATFSSGTATRTTDETGHIIFNDLTIGSTGTYNLTFTADDYPAVQATSNGFDVIDAIASMTFNVQPSETTAGQPVAGHPTILLANSIGMPLENVDISVFVNQQSIVSGTTTVTTDENGLAVFDDLVINAASQNYQLIFNADYSGVQNITSNTFNVFSAPADDLIVKTQPLETFEGATIEGPPAAKVTDAYGNPVAGINVNVSEITAGAIDAGITAISTNSDGLAAFSTLIINENGTYQLSFSATGLSNTTTNTFQVVPGTVANRFKGSSHSGYEVVAANDKLLGQTPVRMEMLTDPLETVAGFTIEGPPAIAVYDATDNPVPNVQVTVSAVGGSLDDGTFTRTTDDQGTITFNNLKMNTPGTYHLSFTADNYSGTVSDIQSAEFDVVDQVYTMQITKQPENSTAGQSVAGVPKISITNFINQPLAGIDVTVYVNQYDFASGSITVETDASGEAVFDDLVLNTAASGYQLIFDADYSGISNVTSDVFKVSNAAPANLLITAQPGETSEGAAVTGPPAVQLTDVYGNPVSGETITVSETGGYAFDGGTTNQTTDETGNATFSDLIINTVGSYGLTFGHATVSDAVSQLFNVQSGTVANRFKGSSHSGFGITETTNKELGQTPVRIEILVQPQETVAGLEVAGPPQIVVYDEVDNPVGNVDVSVSVPGGFKPGSVTTLSTDSVGKIIYENLIIESVGNYQLSFSADNYPTVTAQSDPFDVIEQQLFLSVTTQPTETVAGQSVAGYPTVQLANSIGQGYSGVDVTVYLNQYDFASDPATQTVTTDASGYAEFDQLVINQAAEGYQLLFDADYSGVLNVSSDVFNVVKGGVDHLAVHTAPEDTEAGATIAGPPAVIAFDEFDNPVSGVSVNVSETGGYTFDGGVTSGTTDENGVAEFSDLVINTTGNYSLTYSATGVDDIATSTFNILSGTISYRFKGNTHSGFQKTQVSDKKLGQTPTRIEIITQPVETIVSNTIQGPPAVVVYDEVDNPVAGVSIQVTVDGFFDSGTTTLTTDANGEAVFNDLVINTTGTFTLTFAANEIVSVPDVSSQSFDVVNQMLNVSVITQPTNSTAGSPVAGVPVVKLENDFGQGFQGVDIIAHINQYEFTQSSTDTLSTDENGEAVFDNLILEKAAANYQLIFEVDYTGVNNISSYFFTVTHAPAGQLVVITQPGEGLAEAVIDGPPTVALYDDYNNPIPNENITVSEIGGYVFDEGTTTLTTDASGIVVFDDLVINTAGTYTLNFSAAAGGVPDVESDAFSVLPGNTADRYKGGSHSGFNRKEKQNVLLQQVPQRIVILTQPQQSVSNTPIQGPPYLRVYDQTDIPVQNAAVTASLLGGGTSLSGTKTLSTNASGDVLFSDLSIAATGTYQLHFEVGGYPAVKVNSQEFEVITQTLSMAIDEQPQNTEAGQTIGGHPAVQITNEIGQPAPAGIDVVVYPNQNEFSSAPAYDTVQTNASGIAVFDQLTIDIAADDYQLIFEADYPGVSSITSNVFEISPAPADYMQITLQPGDGEAGSVIAGPPTVGVYDIYDNPIQGIDIDVTENNGESLTGTTSITTDENGLAVYSDLIISNPGAYQLLFNADAVGVDNVLSATFNIISTGTIHRFRGSTHSGFSSTVITDQPLTEPPEVEAPVFTVFEDTLCQGTSGTQFTATAANNDSIRYALSISVAGTIDSETGILDLQAGFYGEFYVIATAYGYQGPKADSVKVVVEPEIDAPVFTDPVMEVCQGGTATYLASSVHTDTIAYSVTPAASGTMDANTGEMVWAVDFNGTSHITATAGEADDCGGQKQTTIDVTVKPEVGTPTFTQGATELCQGAPSETYTATADNADSVIYSRSPNEAGNIDINTGEMTWYPDFSGTAVITARAKGQCNGDKDQTRTVTVHPKPTTGPIDGEIDVACNAPGENYSVTLTSGSDYAWDVPAGATITSGDTGPDNNTITVDFADNNGYVSVIETTQYGCVGDEAELQVMLHGCDLAANFEANETETCIGEKIAFSDLSTGTVDTWEWDFGAAATPSTVTGEGPHDVIYNAEGTYSVTLTVKEQTVEDTKTITDYITVNSQGTWLGAVSSSWFEPENWSCGVVPDAGESPFDVIISQSATFNPEISSAGARVRNIEIENGATLNVVNGTTIDVYGNWHNDGIFSPGNSTIKFRGDNSQITGSAITSFNNLQVVAGKQVTAPSGTMHIQGDLVVDGAFSHNNGTVFFTGTAAQEISGSVASVTFNNFESNNSDGGLTISNAVNIAGNLVLTDGVIYTDNSNFINIMNGGGSETGSNSSYIDGPIQKTGTGAYTFPIGDNGVWAPIEIADPGGAGDVFRAEYFDAPNVNANRPCTNCDNDIYYVSGVEYWDLQRVAGSATPDVTMFFKDMTRSGINDLDDLLYAHWNGVQWVNMTAGTTNLGANECSVTGTGFTSYSPQTAASGEGTNPLPVELLSFEALARENYVSLNWQTATETDNDYFTVERTTDGEHFEMVGTLQGGGNSSVMRDYTLKDYSPYLGTSYYRLSQTDFDGVTEVFPMVEVYFEESFNTPHLQVFPNPALSHKYNIRINNIGTQSFTLVIFDDLGNQIYDKKYRPDRESTYELLAADDIDKELKPGIYFINVTGKHFQLRKKMIIY